MTSACGRVATNRPQEVSSVLPLSLAATATCSYDPLVIKTSHLVLAATLVLVEALALIAQPRIGELPETLSRWRQSLRASVAVLRALP
jgi:hypothetical protein